ncbi:hypothetical protein D3C80_939520 [compost metagenome]
MLLGGARDLGRHVLDTVGCLHYGRQLGHRLLRIVQCQAAQVASLGHGVDRGARGVPQPVYHLLDLLGRGPGLGGQGAHLVGHHGKASAMLAGPGRLDGGIERQQVGLLRDGPDHIQDAAYLHPLLLQGGDPVRYLAHLRAQLTDAIGRGAHHLLPLVHGMAGLIHRLGRDLGTAGDRVCGR